MIPTSTSQAGEMHPRSVRLATSTAGRGGEETLCPESS